MVDTALAGLFAYEALDSRGRPTVACVARLRDGTEAEALAPAGASTGRHEAKELRDGEKRFGGRGVHRAVTNVTGELFTAVVGCDVVDQDSLDARLRAADGTPNLARLGANAVLAVSLACARAAAAAKRVPLWRHVAGEADPLIPLPMVNILSGGAHAGGIVDVQDYLVIPVGATSFAEAMEWVSRVRHQAAQLIKLQGGTPDLVADEGGLAHAFADNTAGLELLTCAIEGAALRPAEDMGIALDVAATQLLVPDGRYRLAREGLILTSHELVAIVENWARRYPIVSVEDPLSEDDWSGFEWLRARLPDMQIIGDDLFATSRSRVLQGAEAGTANAVLAKINQNGTISGTAEVVRTAQEAGMAVVVSARSGETEDSSIADLAIGWRAGQIKVGSLTRSERTSKWNRVLRIEAELGSSARFAGRDALSSQRSHHEGSSL